VVLDVAAALLQVMVVQQQRMRRQGPVVGCNCIFKHSAAAQTLWTGCTNSIAHYILEGSKCAATTAAAHTNLCICEDCVACCVCNTMQHGVYVQVWQHHQQTVHRQKVWQQGSLYYTTWLAGSCAVDSGMLSIRINGACSIDVYCMRVQSLYI
jgi:hypothetical protein